LQRWPHFIDAKVVRRPGAGQEPAMVDFFSRVPEEPPAAIPAAAFAVGLGFARQHDAASLLRDAYLGDGRLPHGEEQGDEAHQHQLCKRSKGKEKKKKNFSTRTKSSSCALTNFFFLCVNCKVFVYEQVGTFLKSDSDGENIRNFGKGY